MNERKVPAAVGFGMVALAGAFAIGSLSHVPVTIGPISEPRIVPAAIVEAICGAALAMGGTAVLRNQSRSWELAFGAQVISACGVLLGMVALAAGRGPRTQLNDVFHAVALTALCVGIGALWQRGENGRNVDTA